MEFSASVERIGRASGRWLERHPRLGRPLGWLREHWVLALAVLSLSLLILFVNPVRIVGLFLAPTAATSS